MDIWKIIAQNKFNIMDTATAVKDHMGENIQKIDPSSLTTQQLWREIAALKELMLTHIMAMEQAIKVAHDDLTRFPTEVQKAITTLKDLHEEKFGSVTKEFTAIAALRDEKFAGVQKQFSERDVRVEQTAKDTKTAVDAALAAQEKAVAKQNESFVAATNKSEAATTKQIDAQGSLITTATNALESKISDLKERLLLIEGRSGGRKDLWGYVAGGIMLIIAIITILIRTTAHA